MIELLLLSLQISRPPLQATAVAPGAKVVAVLPFEVAQAVNISARQTLTGGDKKMLAEHYSDVARQLLEDRVVGVDGVRVVERSRLDAVIAEHKLGQTGLIDTRTAAKVGRALGARYTLLGSFLDIVVAEGNGEVAGTRVETTKVTATVRVRLIENEAAEVVRSWSARGDHTEMQRLTREVLLDWGVPVITDALDQLDRDSAFTRELSQ